MFKNIFKKVEAEDSIYDTGDTYEEFDESPKAFIKPLRGDLSEIYRGHDADREDKDKRGCSEPERAHEKGSDPVFMLRITPYGTCYESKALFGENREGSIDHEEEHYKNNYCGNGS